MSQMRFFSESNQTRFFAFLNALCDVDDFYDTLELDQFMALTKKDLTISISMNELIGIHDLFSRHIDAMRLGESGEENASSILTRSLSSASRSHVPQKSLDDADFSNIATHKLNFPTPTTATTFSPPSSQQTYFPHSKNLVESSPQSIDPLRRLLIELGDPVARVPRAENKTIVLGLRATWNGSQPFTVAISSHSFHAYDFCRQHHILAIHEQQETMTQSENLFLDSKASMVSYLRALYSAFPTEHSNLKISTIPADFHPPMCKILQQLEYSGKSNNPALVKSAGTIQQNLSILEFKFHHPKVSKNDGYVEFARQVHAEFVHLNALHKKRLDEVALLESVHQTVCDYNYYLQSQLESYKAYLLNVRVQAGVGSTLSSFQGSFLQKAGAAESGQSNFHCGPFKGHGLVATPRTLSVLHALQPSNIHSFKFNSFDKKAPVPQQSVSVSAGPLKFTHAQLEKDGVIVASNVPDRGYVAHILLFA